MAKNTVFLTIGSIAQKLLSFVYFLIVARLLGVEQTGKYLFALYFMTTFSVITDAGLQPVIIREVARVRDETQKVLRNALAIKLFLSIIAAVALMIVAGATETDPVRLQLIQFAAVVMVLDTIHLIFYAVLRGYQQLRYEAIGMAVGQVITIAAGASILLLRLPLPYLVFSLALGSLWNVLFSGMMVKKVSGVSFGFGFHWPTWRRIIVMAIPFALAAVFVKIYASADSIMLGKLLGDRAVALYGVPYKFAFAFQFVPIALAAALFPAFGRALEENRASVAGIFAAAERYLMLIVLPLVAGMIVLARPILISFYGNEYEPAVLIMQILAISLLSAFLDFPVGALLNAAHKQNVQTIWMGITMATNIGLNLMLIPVFGAVGAAIAAVVGNFILFLGGLTFIPKIIKVPWKTLGTSFVRIATASVLMGTLVALTDSLLPLPVSITLGVLVYLGALYLFREIGTKEFKRIRDFIRPTRKPIEQSL